MANSKITFSYTNSTRSIKYYIIKTKMHLLWKRILIERLKITIDSCFSFPNFERDDASSFKSTLELPPNFIMIDYAKLTKT